MIVNGHHSKTNLIIGLGNPGKEHRYNRHNAGFMLLDKLADDLHLEFTRHQLQSLVANGSFNGSKIILAKPQTFMNNSGRSVGSLTHFYRIPHSDLLVVYDDLDLSPGTIQLRPAGGSAGHNGMRSIFENLGTQAFPRLRIGIGRPPGQMDPADYVLQDFSSADLQLLDITLRRAVECVRLYIQEGIQSAMTKYNSPLT